MNPLLLPHLVEIISLAFVAIVAFAYGAYLSTWVSSHVSPAVPLISPWLAGGFSALLAVPIAWLSSVSAAYTVIAALAPILILSSFVDALTKRIPNAYVLHALMLVPVSGLWLLLSGSAASTTWWTALLWSIGLGFGTFLAFLGMNLFSRGGLGMGDVKFGAVLAFYLIAITTFNWNSAVLTSAVAPLLMILVLLVWLTLSFLGGGIWAVARGLHRNKKSLPFGPFLVAGFIATIAASPLITAAATAAV